MYQKSKSKTFILFYLINKKKDKIKKLRLFHNI